MPPLMNCTTAHFIPCAMARKIMPKAAEDLPLPLPVWTMIRPFSSVLVAMILSRAAFFLAIFSAWRASSCSILRLLEPMEIVARSPGGCKR